MFIYSYNLGSASFKVLHEALSIKSIKHENSKFKGSNKKLIINWGASALPPEVLKCQVLNHPDAVEKAVDKLKFFELNKDFSVPFTTSKEEALKWLNAGLTVVVRNKVKAHGGEGIEIINNAQELKDAPLYTRYIPKKEEYRIHVHAGEVFFVQRKARVKEGANENVNWQVRNLAGGFIFANKDVVVDDKAKELAITVVKNLNLDFGAVDVIFNERSGKYYALEVNTAPGLSGTTLEKYTEIFNSVRD